MALIDIFIALALAIAMIFVGYVIYFYPQKYLLARAKTPLTTADQRIPFQPKWVWIYSGLYYPFWVSPILFVSNYAEFFAVCTSYALLLAAQMFISHLYPVKTPDKWRSYDRNNSYSELFLGFIQTLDKGGNGFPSMHVGVAVLTTLHIIQFTGYGDNPEIYLVWVMPAFVALSTLYTKQHLIIDIPAGALLAVAIYTAQANFAYVS